MGHYSKYICKNCGYTYEGSGGPDHGKFGYVYNTFNCMSCKKTFDYGVLNETEELKGKTSIADCICNNCNGKDIELWNKKCPCCNSEMTLDMKSFGITFWD